MVAMATASAADGDRAWGFGAGVLVPGERGRAMTDFFLEWAVRERMREAEERVRTLERWGWFPRGRQPRERPTWRFRLGTALVRAGCRLQGIRRSQQVPEIR